MPYLPTCRLVDELLGQCTGYIVKRMHVTSVVTLAGGQECACVVVKRHLPAQVTREDTLQV